MCHEHPPPKLFVSPSAVVDVPHYTVSNTKSNLPAEGSLGQHHAESNLRLGAWDTPKGHGDVWFESQGLSAN